MRGKQTAIPDAGDEAMHKDLSEGDRLFIEADTEAMVVDLFHRGQSLAIAREAWINAFDKAAEELETRNAQS